MTKDKLVLTSQIQSVELWISYLLRGGVILSGTIILFGLILSFYSGDSRVLSVLMNGSELKDLPIPHSMADASIRIKNLESRAIIAGGIQLLIFLPVMRVILTAILFLKEKDYTFLFLSCFVLMTLSIGLFMGRAI